MKKTLLKILIVTMILGITSCGRDYKIDKTDFLLIPYNGKEILIFKSSNNKIDTIFLKGFEKYKVDSDPLSIFPDKFEIYNLNCKHSDSNEKYERYLEGSLIKLSSFSDSKTYIEFNISVKGTMGNCTLSKEEFENLPLTKLIINDIAYTDLKIFKSDIYTGNYPEKYYWSLKEGLVGIDDKNNNITWRLKKKYVP